MEMWIYRILGGTIVVILTEYFVKFRPGLSEKFRHRTDCDKMWKTCHNENREDHQTIFKSIEKEHLEIMGKLDIINKQIFDILKGINKLNGD